MRVNVATICPALWRNRWSTRPPTSGIAGHRIDFADLDRSEVEVRTTAGERLRLVVALRVDHEEPADDLLRLGEGAVGDRVLRAVAPHDAACAIFQLLPAGDFSLRAKLVRPRPKTAENLLQLLGAQRTVGAVVPQHQNVLGHDFLSFQCNDERRSPKSTRFIPKRTKTTSSPQRRRRGRRALVFCLRPPSSPLR